MICGWTRLKCAMASPKTFSSSMMIPKIIVVAPTTAVPIKTGLAVALKVFPAPSPFSNSNFASGEIRFEAEIAFDFRADVRLRFDAAQFVNGLRVVGDGAEAVHGNRDRSHREETERDEAEGKDWRGEIKFFRQQRQEIGVLRKQKRREHQRKNHEAHPERGEISGDEAGQNVQRRAAMVGGVGDFFDMARAGADENFRELHDERARERAARNDRGQHPPKIGQRHVGQHAVFHFGDGKITEQQFCCDEADDDGNDRGDPNQISERRFPVEILFAAVTRGRDDFVQIKRAERREHHQRLDREQPDDEFCRKEPATRPATARETR